MISFRLEVSSGLVPVVAAGLWLLLVIVVRWLVIWKEGWYVLLLRVSLIVVVLGLEGLLLERLLNICRVGCLCDVIVGDMIKCLIWTFKGHLAERAYSGLCVWFSVWGCRGLLS